MTAEPKEWKWSPLPPNVDVKTPKVLKKIKQGRDNYNINSNLLEILVDTR